MSSTKSNPVMATVAVITCLAAGLFGYFAREKADMGTAAPNLTDRTFLASNEASADISASQYFFEVSELLRSQYVESIEVDQKLASGAVRGMVNSLLDPNSIYMNPEQFEAHKKSLTGEFYGVGVELEYVFNQEELKKAQEGETTTDGLMLLPELIIATVLPNSPAAEAGLKVGDRITEVNKKHLVSHKEITELRRLQNLVTEGKLTAAELSEAAADLREKVAENIPINKAREHLITGDNETVELAWLTSDNQTKRATLNRKVTKVPAIQKLEDNVIALHFFQGASQDLAKQNLKDGATIDLTQSTYGHIPTMIACLELVAPAEKYGSIVTARPGQDRSLITESGPIKPIQLNLIVDSSTRGAAKIFAQALADKGYATLIGKLPPSPAKWLTTETLPDGAGYTLMTGTFTTNEATRLEATNR